jgi:MraZ protein
LHQHNGAQTLACKGLSNLQACGKIKPLPNASTKWEKVLFCVKSSQRSSNPLIMTGFLGEFEATLDAKGRFLLPAGLKKQLPEGENTRFVINRGFEKCLSLYPRQSWEPLFARISALNDFDPSVRSFRRYFLNGATEVELDSAGRLLLPPQLKDYAGLEKDIVLASAVDKIEIWSTDNYNKFFESYAPTDFSALAQQVMGGGNLG